MLFGCLGDEAAEIRAIRATIEDYLVASHAGDSASAGAADRTYVGGELTFTLPAPLGDAGWSVSSGRRAIAGSLDNHGGARPWLALSRWARGLARLGSWRAHAPAVASSRYALLANLQDGLRAADVARSLGASCWTHKENHCCRGDAGTAVRPAGRRCSPRAAVSQEAVPP